MQNTIQNLRKPLFKTVSHSTMDKDTEIYRLYSTNTLTEAFLLSSNENPFIIAFFYNELFKIEDFMLRMKEREMSNQLYNVMKYYSKNMNKEKIDQICDRSDDGDSYSNQPTALHRESNDKAWRILKGEMYRMNKIDTPIHDPYTLLGYCTVGTHLLPNFEGSLDRFERKREAIEVFMEYVDDQRIFSKVLEYSKLCLDIIMNSRNILDSLDINKLSEGELLIILKEKPEYLHKVKGVDRRIEIGLKLSESVEGYESVKGILQKSIDDSNGDCDDGDDYSDCDSNGDDYSDCDSNGDDYSDCDSNGNHSNNRNKDINNTLLNSIMKFFLVSHYYEPSNFNRPFFMNTCLKLKHTDTYKILSLEKKDITVTSQEINSSTDFFNTVELFSKFVCYCNFNVPELEFLLELPEKFFCVGLKYNLTLEDLRKFNGSVMNERERRKIRERIDKEVMDKYLSKRMHCNRLSTDDRCDGDRCDGDRCDDNDCCDGDRCDDNDRCDDSDRKTVNDRKAVSDNKTDANHSFSMNSNNNDTLPDNNNDTFPDNNNTTGIDYVHANTLLQSIYNHIKDNTIHNHIKDNTIHNHIKDNILSDSELIHILRNLFQWTKFNNTQAFMLFYIECIKCYPLEYSRIREIMLFLFQKFKDVRILTSTVKSMKFEGIRLFLEDIYGIVDDFELDCLCGVLCDSHSDGQGEGLHDDRQCDDDGQQGDSHSGLCDGQRDDGRGGRLCDGSHCDDPQSNSQSITQSNDNSPIHKLTYQLIHSNNIRDIEMGVRIYDRLKSPAFTLDHLLDNCLDSRFDSHPSTDHPLDNHPPTNHLSNHPSTSTAIINTIIKHSSKNNTPLLLSILLKRPTFDTLSIQIYNKLDFSLLNSTDLNRIHELLHLNPINCIKVGLINEDIVLDAIRILPEIYSEEIYKALESFELTDSCYCQMIVSLEKSNISYKNWIFNRLDTGNITLPFFVKLCWFICNEDDLDVVRKGLTVMKKGRVFGVIEKWARERRFIRLTRRVYGLLLKCDGLCDGLCDGVSLCDGRCDDQCDGVSLCDGLCDGRCDGLCDSDQHGGDRCDHITCNDHQHVSQCDNELCNDHQHDSQCDNHRSRLDNNTTNDNHHKLLYYKNILMEMSDTEERNMLCDVYGIHLPTNK